MLFKLLKLKDYLKKSHESVYFYTLHKCASSLFSGFVLRNVTGLKHVDYTRLIYRGKTVDQIIFKKNDHVYGPIRLSVDPQSPVSKRFVEPVSQVDFIRDKIAVFLIRDPRDILVSSYYSFGFTHSWSPVKEIRERQEMLRDDIQSKSLDQFVLESAPETLENFEKIKLLNNACSRSVVLKYEDMIDRWDFFIKDFTKYVKLKDSVVKQFYEQTRPKEKEDQSAHRRSGKSGGFRAKIKSNTIVSINDILKPALVDFKYAI